MSTETKNASKQKMAEKIWLGYFNEYLFEQGLIDEKTRNKLRVRIESEQRK